MGYEVVFFSILVAHAHSLASFQTQSFTNTISPKQDALNHYNTHNLGSQIPCGSIFNDTYFMLEGEVAKCREGIDEPGNDFWIEFCSGFIWPNEVCVT